MEGSELNIVEQNTAGSDQFSVFGQLFFFFEAVLDFENPFIPGLRTFENTDNRAHCDDEDQHPLIAEFFHGRLFESVIIIMTVIYAETLYMD